MGRRIAISGASGLIGSKLTAWFREMGDEVWRLVRHSETGAAAIYWNHDRGEIEAARLEGMDVVIHLAGMPLDERRWTPAVKRGIYSSRVTGTALVSETLAQLKAPPRLLISASATDYYADSDAPIGEEQGLPGTGFMAEMCRDWEAATAPAARAGIRVVQIRIPSVLAANGHSILAAFLPLFRRGLGFVLGSGVQLMCFIARDDLVRAIDHIVSCDRIIGPVNVLAPEAVTNREFATTLGRVLGRRVRLRVPAVVLRAAMGEIAESILAGDSRLLPEKLTATGFRFDFPDIESAIRHELAASAH